MMFAKKLHRRSLTWFLIYHNGGHFHIENSPLEELNTPLQVFITNFEDIQESNLMFILEAIFIVMFILEDMFTSWDINKFCITSPR